MSVEDALYPFLSAYERLPRGLKVGLGASYRRLPQRVRLGARFAEFRQLATEVETWSEAGIAAYQLQQLRTVLSLAAAHSPFYARRFEEAGFDPTRMSDLSEMSQCPYLTKADLAAHLEEMTTSPSRRDRLYITTGGSTGMPVGLYLQRGVSRPKEQAFLEAQWKRGGYFEGARLVVIRGSVTSRQSAGAIASYDATRDWLMLSSYHLTERRLAEYLEEVSRFKPDVLHAYPSAALQLAELLGRAERRWPVPLRCLLAGSERLTEPQKRLLEEVFSCRVYAWYGHAERVVLAGAGRTSDLLYFWPTYGYVEFGPPDAEGLREVIGTSFHNLVLPLIRYRTGDFVRVHDPAAGGAEFPWPAVEAVEGREQEFLVTATGRKISLTAFNMHDDSFDDVYALQFFQSQPGRAELRYVVGPSFRSERLGRIESVLRTKLGDDLEVSLRQVDEIEKTARGKGKWLVSTLADSSHGGGR